MLLCGSYAVCVVSRFFVVVAKEFSKVFSVSFSILLGCLLGCLVVAWVFWVVARGLIRCAELLLTCCCVAPMVFVWFLWCFVCC